MEENAREDFPLAEANRSSLAGPHNDPLRTLAELLAKRDCRRGERGGRFHPPFPILSGSQIEFVLSAMLLVPPLL